MTDIRDSGFFPTAVKNALLSNQNAEEQTASKEDILEQGGDQHEKITAEAERDPSIINDGKEDKSDLFDRQKAVDGPVEDSTATFVETPKGRNKGAFGSARSLSDDGVENKVNSKCDGTNFGDRGPELQKDNSRAATGIFSKNKYNLYSTDDFDGSNLSSKKTRCVSERGTGYRARMNTVPEGMRSDLYNSKKKDAYQTKNVKPPRDELFYPKKSRTIDPPKIDDFTQGILDGHRVEVEPTVEQLRSASTQLTLLERHLVENGKYLKAKKAQSVLDQVLLKLKKVHSSVSDKGDIDEMLYRRNELLNLVGTYSEKWDKRIEEHRKLTLTRLKQMDEDHKKELNKFDENVPTELEPIFKRNSSAYIKMRLDEKHYAYSKNYDEAHKIKQKADKLEKEEEEMNHEKMNKHYKDKRKKLIENYERSVANYKDNSKIRLAELKASKSRVVDPIIERVKRLEKQIEYMRKKRGISPRGFNSNDISNDRLEKSKEGYNTESKPGSFRGTGGTTPKIQRPKVQPQSRI